jgi:hypothetical protein
MSSGQSINLSPNNSSNGSGQSDPDAVELLVINLYKKIPKPLRDFKEGTKGDISR